MSWVVIALLGAAVSALVSIFDKTVIYRYAKTPLTLPLLIGFAQVTVGVVLLAIVRLPDALTLTPVLLALASGALYGLSGQFLMRVLFSNEVSRTIPVFQTYPIFTAIFAFLFFGEHIGLIGWLAILTVVAGGMLMSYRPERSYRGFLLDPSFLLLMIGSAIQGSTHVLGKAAVDELPLLFTHALRSLSLGGVFLLFNLRPEPFRNVVELFRTRSPALRFVAANELLIANAGLFLLLWALSLGPASLVTALSATRAFFLVVYSTSLALVWRGALGEVTTRGAIAAKAGSTALIVGGVTAITLSGT